MLVRQVELPAEPPCFGWANLPGSPLAQVPETRGSIAAWGLTPVTPTFSIRALAACCISKIVEGHGKHARKDVQQKHELSRSFCYFFYFLGSIPILLDGI